MKCLGVWVHALILRHLIQPENPFLVNVWLKHKKFMVLFHAFFSVCLLKFSAKIIYSSANLCVSDMWLFSLSFYSHSASQL
uniref:Uncharacterized protein n=1 Tax=Noccaea caerulescens TaxID=107243 RepID=A0A1J3IP60_NOCCA